MKFCSIDINGIRGKILELLDFLDAHQPHVVALQETKTDSTFTISELFPETCMYSVYRKDRNTHGDEKIEILIHRDISHMPIMKLENNSESVWVKLFANKSSHYIASWYRQPNGTVEDFLLFRNQLDHIKSQHKSKKKKLPSVNVICDFNFREFVWPTNFGKSGSMLSQSEGQMLFYIMDDHGLEQMILFPTRDKKTLGLILTSLPGQFQNIHSPNKFSDHDIVSGF